jgi:GAF domain-containing protein
MEEKSALYVPLVVGDQARGLINLIDMEREHAYSESDVRLLQTLANSMSVALEKARLFDETQRLFKESEQRAPSSRSSTACSRRSPPSSTCRGSTTRSATRSARSSTHATWAFRVYDPQTDMIHFPYVYENGKRMVIASNPLGEKGFSAHVLRTRETLVINENMAQAIEKFGSFLHPGTQMDKSAIYVPLVAGDQARGLISLSDIRREHAYSASDVRLLQTLANAMSVALENARLFDETQRLFKESEQRARELGDHQQRAAGARAELNMQGIYDAVGDKIREIFDQADMSIRIYDPLTDLISYPYSYEKGKRIHIGSHPLSDKGFAAHVMRTRETIVVNRNMADEVVNTAAGFCRGPNWRNRRSSCP